MFSPAPCIFWSILCAVLCVPGQSSYKSIFMVYTERMVGHLYSYYHSHLKMMIVNVIHGCIVKISLCFVPDKKTLNCADYNGGNSVVIISNINLPGNIHIKDDTVFYAIINSR